MDDAFDQLDDQARLVVEVALGTAGAFGDVECGTAYLLYGAVATAQGEVTELTDLFALTPLRVERAITAVRNEAFGNGAQYDGDPMLSREAKQALHTPRKNNDGPTGVFELLLGILSLEDSEANEALRFLGVRTDEFLRLVTYGTWHLSSDEADELLSSLDRRVEDPYLPWWGPTEDEEGIELLSSSQPFAKSRSAEAQLLSVRAVAGGLAITIKVESLDAWVLSPELEPREVLTPGLPATHRIGPELFRLSVVSDAGRISNELAHDRWTTRRPETPVLVPISSEVRTVRSNDRRSVPASELTCTWWVYGPPVGGAVEIRADWPAEVLHGATMVDLDVARAL